MYRDVSKHTRDIFRKLINIDSRLRDVFRKLGDYFSIDLARRQLVRIFNDAGNDLAREDIYYFKPRRNSLQDN